MGLACTCAGKGIICEFPGASLPYIITGSTQLTAIESFTHGPVASLTQISQEIEAFSHYTCQVMPFQTSGYNYIIDWAQWADTPHKLLAAKTCSLLSRRILHTPVDTPLRRVRETLPARRELDASCPSYAVRRSVRFFGRCFRGGSFSHHQRQSHGPTFDSDVTPRSHICSSAYLPVRGGEGGWTRKSPTGAADRRHGKSE